MNNILWMPKEKYHQFQEACLQEFKLSSEALLHEWLQNLIENAIYQKALYERQKEQEVPEELLNDPLYRMGDGISYQMSLSQ